ncbi:MAG: TRAP transporter small permease subunit [Gammaproteobacteria bacterium]|jgi:TRAP-type mannitol/chloroaromatic compound transport system permease small subunit|nr:TRAP transporter small permease subunit [Gammaproteobacteria bacterium]
MNKSVLLTIADAIDAGVKRTGNIIAWTYILLIIAIISQVILRRGFHSGLIALEELQWHLYAIGVMFGMAYTQVLDAHVRVDLLHQNMRHRTQQWIEIIGILLLAIPFIGTLFINSFDFVYESWRVSERSWSPSGLPFTWAIKAVIPLSCGLLLIAFVARIARCIHLLRTPAPEGA